MKTPQQDIGNSVEPRLYQGQALRVCAVRPALTEPSLHAHPESGKGDGAAGAHPLTSGGAQVLGLIFKGLPTNSADEADIFAALTDEGTLHSDLFCANTTGTALDDNDSILYNTSSGALLYDADGSGEGVSVQFATLTNKPEISANDFLVIA